MRATLPRAAVALAYLHSLGGDDEARVREIDTWAHYIGAPSIRWFVRELDGTAQARTKACERDSAAGETWLTPLTLH
jgi:hypothetical protein